jgi:diguanylate cyclase (GGDEF)-like protein
MSLDTKNATGMILALVFCSEHIDKSGESLNIKGISLDIFDEGNGVVNYEHKSSKDANGEEVVGKVIYSKKIYSKSDCNNDLEKNAWEDLQLPFVWGIVRLFDVAGHSGAQALAASIRDQEANKEKIILRASIEGSTVKREGNKLEETIARRLTLTFSPANAVCNTTLISDPGAPDGFKKEFVIKELPEIDALKFENPEYTKLASNEVQLSILDEKDLNKAIEAGSYNAAPSSLVGGAALQREDVGRKPLKDRVKSLLLHEWGDKFDKAEVRKLIKFQLPEVSDSYLDHFENAIEDLHIKRNSIKKHEDVVPNIFRLHQLEILLRKNIEELKVNSLTDAHVPQVYTLFYKVDDKEYVAGRFMLYNNTLTHLEDYHGMLDRFLPEGPLDFTKVSQIYNLRNGNLTRIENDPLKLDIDDPKPEEAAPEPVQKRPASVFDYMRSGMDQPHTIEVNGGVYYLDGNKLSDDEIGTIYNNLNSNIASLRYKNADLNKAEELDPASALSHVRNAVAAGHMHPDVERALTRHIYQDPMTGMGNKYAYSEFRKQNKPGVHVNLDAQNLKSINDAFGHDTGDEAIKTLGRHISDAAEEAAPGSHKGFRPGGDEFGLHFPSHEHAAKFARGLTQRLQDTPPIQGVHKLSVGMGFGHTPEMADKALLMAKEQKYLPGQEGVDPRQKKSKFPLGQTPSLAHSLIPGKEGAIPIHDTTPEAIKASIPEPAKPAEPKAA